MILLLAVADWRMTTAFAGAMAMLVLVLKILSVIQERRSWTSQAPSTRSRNSAVPFWLTLLPSVRSLARIRPAGSTGARRALGRFALVVPGAAVIYMACEGLARTTGARGIWLAWIGAPAVWLMGEVMGSLAQVVTLPSRQLLPLPHENVFAARSVSDFWGRRWNVWMSDWFRQMLFEPMRRRPVLAVVVVFLLSGVIHELVINLGLWLITGRNLFGSMLIYFGLQGTGLLVERLWVKGDAGVASGAGSVWRSGASRVFCWLVVLGPAPFMVNEGILRALWLWR